MRPTRQAGSMEDAWCRVTLRTKAVVAVHLWGVPEDTDRLTAFAGRHGLKLLEDGSHAFGATWDGRAVGSTGHALAPYAVTGMVLKLRIPPLAAALSPAQLPRLEGYPTGRAASAGRMCAALWRCGVGGGPPELPVLRG
ncbi:DegT/DnrJ/EryC1/StrS family aminotransferase [Streptomyces sp. NPDC093085]|uniref:DegT/DnrJ/EryC1/StrS family aminotransferase n=1 Tax=Streptomyces sp. NPDC093085 TaxID=3155068 RepID=UPI0034272F69